MIKSRDNLKLIDELIKKYGDAAESIISSGLSLESKGHNRYRCPNGHAHKNNDKTPAMNWVSDGHYFHCKVCGNTINIYTYLHKYLHQTFSEIMKSESIDGFIEKRNGFIAKKESEISKITKEQIEYCKSRGITEETIKKFKLSNANGYIGMPYFVDGFLSGVKKKNIKNDDRPKNISIEGSKFGLFNRDNVDMSKPLIIVEGEFDCMIVDQCGYNNVVSVGTGANSVESVIEICNDFINQFTEVILFSDNDEFGDTMDEKFKSAFNNIAEIDKSEYGKHKDANDIFLAEGKEGIERVLSTAKFIVSGLIDANSFDYETIQEVNKGKFIPTGFPTIDKALNELRPGYTTLVTGRANDGKSTFVLQVIANAIENDAKVFWVSGEESIKDLYLNFLKLLIGNEPKHHTVIAENKDYIKLPTKEVFTKIKKWHDGKFQIFNKGESKLRGTKDILDMVRKMIKKEGINLVVIDNLMSILSAKAAEKNEAQADFMQELHDIAQNTNCHIILVLHPNKELRKGQDMEFEMISGTSDLANKADNVIAVRKAHDQELESKGINGFVQILKNRKKPDLKKIQTNYNVNTGMLSEVDEQMNIYRKGYSWNKPELKIREEFIQVKEDEEDLYFANAK